MSRGKGDICICITVTSLLKVIQHLKGINKLKPKNVELGRKYPKKWLNDTKVVRLTIYANLHKCKVMSDDVHIDYVINMVAQPFLIFPIHYCIWMSAL